ncbi:uncharacterized protein Z520_04300 [Fonsecaea multimorphosa CBS 102226]|uniref:Uncharacterized protein n=1 Tax=Fonsecaea multimorphosa CBS 102226 TaxID=1442371 RepID=A0A0D2HCN5_9EURO|nr:uncharacterized protein Z520_04300 [Fonsecaea multimorphosa CBS 102226]KIX99665.1 hypothetical protein Z520_04300 [Fonsecaea multimorphosa CBS 102226]OAL26717.1 hypothetical protein AYO22_04070 [Fonsecaea multimorphosa]
MAKRPISVLELSNEYRSWSKVIPRPSSVIYHFFGGLYWASFMFLGAAKLQAWSALFLIVSHIIILTYLFWIASKFRMMPVGLREMYRITPPDKALQKLGGAVESLKALPEISKYGRSGKPLDAQMSDHDPTPPASPTSTDMTELPRPIHPNLKEPVCHSRSELHDKAQAQLVTWKCSCGSILSDYYTEIIPGSVELLQAELQEEASPYSNSFRLLWWNLQAWITSTLRTRAVPSQNPANTTQGSPETTSSSSSAGLRVPGYNISSSSGDPTQTPSQPLSAPRSVNPPQGQPSASRVFYLLLCLPEKLSGFRLYHQQLLQTTGSAHLPNYVVNDKQLFNLLRRKYSAVRRRTVFSLLWPRTVIRVSLAHFLVDGSDLVELIHYACHGAGANCKCIPPATDNGYHCVPRPSPYSPPIGTNYLTHLFQHPECIRNGNNRVLNQVPKRFGQCIAISGDKAIEAWGIEFEEGWDRGRLRNAVFLVVVVATLLFATLWAVMEHDIQSAFAISAYFISILAIVGGYMASTEPRLVHK